MASKNCAEHLLYIYNEANRIFIITFPCHDYKHMLHLEIDDPKKYFSEFPELFKETNIKAVILQVFSFTDANYPDNMKFCLEMKDYMDKANVPYYFITNLQLTLTTLLFAANITSNIQEYAMTITVEDGYFHIDELKYTENGYEDIDCRKIFEEECNSLTKKDLLKKIIGNKDPKKVIICTRNDCKMSDRLKNVLKEVQPITILDESMPIITSVILEISKWLLDNSCTKFHVIPWTVRAYGIAYESGNEKFLSLFVNKNENLPLEKRAFISNEISPHYLVYHGKENNEFVTLQNISIDGNAHAFSAVLKVDINNFPVYEITRMELCENLKALLQICNKKFENFEQKPPVISLFCNRSVICVHQNGEYQFLDSWGGIWGKKLYVSFDKEKPQYFEAAENTLSTSGRSVVHDLINILSKSTEELLNSSFHGFEVTSDEEHPLLLQFDSFDGTKKAATPQFLFALLLKQHIKAIKAETHKKPDELHFSIFNIYTEDKKKRIQNGVSEACELLKIKFHFCDNK